MSVVCKAQHFQVLLLGRPLLLASTYLAYGTNILVYNSYYVAVQSLSMWSAEIARSGLGALPASQLIPAATTVDSQNRTLDASSGNNYTISLPLPLPVRAFWSLTLYNASSTGFVDNSLNRYSIGDNVSALSASCLSMSTCTLKDHAAERAGSAQNSVVACLKTSM